MRNIQHETALKVQSGCFEVWLHDVLLQSQKGVFKGLFGFIKVSQQQQQTH